MRRQMLPIAVVLATLGAGALARQANWNHHNLTVVLKDKLTQFVKVAGSVDFAAATRVDKGRTVFVNPDYERANPMWKYLYRVGKQPTTAALEIARAWLKEL